jgi:hypothetical protein
MRRHSGTMIHWSERDAPRLEVDRLVEIRSGSPIGLGRRTASSPKRARSHRRMPPQVCANRTNQRDGEGPPGLSQRHDVRPPPHRLCCRTWAQAEGWVLPSSRSGCSKMDHMCGMSRLANVWHHPTWARQRASQPSSPLFASGPSRPTLKPDYGVARIEADPSGCVVASKNDSLAWGSRSFSSAFLRITVASLAGMTDTATLRER